MLQGIGNADLGYPANSADLLIPLGDIVDRGPDSRGVIDELLALQDRCQLAPLLGNHEVMLLDAIDRDSESLFWRQCGGEQTLASYGATLGQVPREHLDFIRSFRRSYETPDHLFVHANYAADAPLDEQPEDLLFWEHLLFTTPPPHQSGKIAVVGHTPQISGEILHLGHLVCIDTFCFGGGWLTALDVASGQAWQADIHGRPRIGRVD